MRFFLLILFCLLRSCTPNMASAGTQELLNTNDPNMNGQLNDTLQQLNQKLTTVASVIPSTAITGILTTAHGGTSANLSAVPANNIIYTSALGVMGNIGIGTTGTVLAWGNPPTWKAATGLGSYTAGDYLVYGPSIVTAGSAGSSSYEKIIEVYLPKGGTLRTKFYILASGSGTSYGRIYRNGVAVGTEQSHPGSIAPIDAYFSEDIAGWSAGDLIQVYAKGDGGGSVKAGDLTLSVSNPDAVSISSAYPNAQVHTLIGTANSPQQTLGSIGDLALRNDGGATTTLYVKTGATTWTSK